MTGLRDVYLARLPTRVEALEEAHRALARDEPLAMESVRRLAHMISGSAGSFGFPEIGRRSNRVEKADPGSLSDELEGLLNYLRSILAEARSLSRVLVVEDDPDLGSALSSRLSNATCSVDVVGSGKEALAEVDKGVPNVIIVDLMLPDMDGRDLVARLRGSASTAMIPVLVLTVRGGRGLRLECMALGANEFFEKPVDIDLLAERVIDELQRALLAEREGRRDGLTGLANRAALAEAFEQVFARSRRTGTKMSLAILDLDFFKSVNDTHGHLAGDATLRSFGEILEKGLRTTDVGARWGGDEFVLLFEGANPVEAVTAIDKLRRACSADEGSLLRGIGFSAGVAEVGETLEATMARADLAMYQAKRTGRGRTLVEGAALSDQAIHLVLAEDDRDMGALVQSVLADQGFQIDWHYEGESALAAILRHPPELVLLDVDMPGRDGFEVLKAVRRKYSARQCRIVMITGTRTQDAIERAFELGADDYLVKPFKPRELIARLRRLVQLLDGADS